MAASHIATKAHHEMPDAAVEDGLVVVSALAQRDEVVACFCDDVTVQLQVDGPK